MISVFLVADLEPQDILGTDFLFKFGAVINLDQKRCRLMGKKIHLLFVNDRNAQSCEVIVHVDKSVPPRSEVLITGEVEGVVDSLQGLSEPFTYLNTL